MKARLKALRRRWLLLVRGECQVEGCTEPARGFPFFGEFCGPHFDEHMHEMWRKHQAAEFEHEVAVTAEALRRTLPAAVSTPQDKEGR